MYVDDFQCCAGKGLASGRLPVEAVLPHVYIEGIMPKGRIYFHLFIVYLKILFQYLRPYSVNVGGKPAASAQFLLNPDSSARSI
jgi:hypothetical protein